MPFATVTLSGCAAAGMGLGSSGWLMAMPCCLPQAEAPWCRWREALLFFTLPPRWPGAYGMSVCDIRGMALVGLPTALPLLRAIPPLSPLRRPKSFSPITPSITFLPAISLDALGDQIAEARDQLSGQLRLPVPHLHSFSIQGPSHGLKQSLLVPLLSVC